jgi:hypothetical protein
MWSPAPGLVDLPGTLSGPSRDVAWLAAPEVSAGYPVARHHENVRCSDPKPAAHPFRLPSTCTNPRTTRAGPRSRIHVNAAPAIHLRISKNRMEAMNDVFVKVVSDRGVWVRPIVYVNGTKEPDMGIYGSGRDSFRASGEASYGAMEVPGLETEMHASRKDAEVGAQRNDGPSPSQIRPEHGGRPEHQNRLGQQYRPVRRMQMPPPAGKGGPRPDVPFIRQRHVFRLPQRQAGAIQRQRHQAGADHVRICRRRESVQKHGGQKHRIPLQILREAD